MAPQEAGEKGQFGVAVVDGENLATGHVQLLSVAIRVFVAIRIVHLAPPEAVRKRRLGSSSSMLIMQASSAVAQRRATAGLDICAVTWSTPCRASAKSAR